jgi:hypothetical protein
VKARITSQDPIACEHILFGEIELQARVENDYPETVRWLSFRPVGDLLGDGVPDLIGGLAVDWYWIEIKETQFRAGIDFLVSQNTWEGWASMNRASDYNDIVYVGRTLE